MQTWLFLVGAFVSGALSLAAVQSLRRRPSEPLRADEDDEIENLTAELHLKQQRAMEALRVNHARWQTLAEALAGGVVLLGRERRILLANAAARKILASLGVPGESDTLESLGPVTLDELLAHHRDPSPMEIRLDGERPRIFEVGARPVVAGTGGEWVLTLAEVTVERETARKLWLRERLAAVGQLAAGIAHDFNNILQSIILAAEMSRTTYGHDLPRQGAASKERSSEIDENLGIILHQAHRAAELVRQILDFARKSPTQPRNLELRPFIEEVVALLRRTLPDSVHWELELGGEHRVESDPAQLQQLLTNLVVNADAAMPDGGTLRIALGETTFARPEDKPFQMMGAGPWVTMAVSDSGCGMPPEVLKRVFEPFFTTKGRARGTGLGLAQVYGIVKQQGGFIDVASQVGEGTTFSIYLRPAETSDGDVEAGQATLEIPEGHGELVLIVDDDAAILRATRMALQSCGYQVLTASDAAEALEIFESRGHDVRLVLSDVAMSGVGGFTLIRKVRELQPDVAVLFMSGYAPRTLEDGPPPAGEAPSVDAPPTDAECLAKPFSLDELAEAVHAALRNPRAERDILKE